MSSGKEVTTMTELNFSACFNWDTLELLELLGKDVHEDDLVLDRYYNMETTWMESNCEALFSQKV
jgi:hypothetical protein